MLLQEGERRPTGRFDSVHHSGGNTSQGTKTAGEPLASFAPARVASEAVQTIEPRFWLDRKMRRCTAEVSRWLARLSKVLLLVCGASL